MKVKIVLMTALVALSSCSEHIKTSWDDYALSEGVQSIHVKTYNAMIVLGKIGRGAKVKDDYNSDNWYDVSFDKQGLAIERKEYSRSQELRYIIKFEYDDANHLTVRNKYHDDGDLSTITNLAWTDDYVSEELLTYVYEAEETPMYKFITGPIKNNIRTNTFIRLGESDKGESMYQLKYENDLVIESYSLDPEKDSTRVFHNYFEYNENNQVIKRIREDHKGTTVTTYDYTYDKRGNWIVQIVRENDKPTKYIERKILYF